MIEGKGKRIKGVSRRIPKRESKAGKKKSAEKWFSLDSLLGKSLCILLVVILTVGAFLAPKVINSLYDARTLMQITYTDLDLSTYAVAYTSFQEKLMALARAKTAGDRLVVLPAEETDEKIGDEELVQLVDQEIAGGGMNALFIEEWWGQLTDENLVSREKATVYAQANLQDNSTGAEMAPIQFWILSFEITDEQKKYRMYEYEKMAKGEKVAIAESDPGTYGTDRLIVCLDAEFYKIYAMATTGDELRIMDRYGWDLSRIFVVDLEDRDWMDEDMYLRMDLTSMNMETWADYWEVMPEDKNIYLNIQGELSGCMAFLDGQAETDDEGAEADDSDMGVDGAGTGNVAAVGGMKVGAMDEEMYNQEYDAYILDSADDIRYGNTNDENEKEILLEVGISGSFGGDDNDEWIQKAGCRDFFEMMQF